MIAFLHKILFSALFATVAICSAAATIQAGCIEGNCTNGQGTYVWPNGDKYVGEWQHGKRHGKGMLVWPDGDRYVGEWVYDRSSCQGTYHFPATAKQYFTDFRDRVSEDLGCIKGDCLNGYGTYTWPSGAQYVGYFENGIRNGLGTYSFPNGRRIPGLWDNGKYAGRM